MLYASGQSRRKFLKTLAGTSVSIGTMPMLRGARKDPAEKASAKLLDEVEARACRYFYDMADPNTGLVRDRANSEEPYAPSVSSIAATGFGLSALAIGASRRRLDGVQAMNRVRTTLRFLCDHAAQERGFFYHFLDSATGQRLWKSELSSVDTAWLLCGVLHTSACWDDPEIRKLATELLNRTDWEWMLNGSQTLCHGWTPEGGFLPLPVGRVLRNSRHVPAGDWLGDTPHSGVLLESVRAAHARIPGHLLHRRRRAAVRPPVFARVVRLPRPQ